MKEYVKEVWIKFDSQKEYSENEERLLALLDKAPGDSLVRVYDASTKGCKKLSSRSFDETQISILADAFGKDNVKFQERKVKTERNKLYTRPIIRQIIPAPMICMQWSKILTEGSANIRCFYMRYAVMGKCTLYSLMIGMVFVFRVMRFLVRIDTN